MTAVCPAGHASDESDYCSVCGAAIPARAAPLTPTPPRSRAASPAGQAPRAQACPVCGEARAHDARFCEVCRYDFVSLSAGPVPPAGVTAPIPARPPPTPAPAPSPALSPAPSRAPAPAPAPAPGRWTLVVTIDPSLDDDPDPAAPPPVEPERVFPVDLAEMLVGRRDDQQNIRPAIPVHDPGASRRHARFVVGADGGVSLHDLASTNGTKLNGQDVVSGSIVPLKEGDQVTLGRWTRIRLQGRP
jgi:hypothetical protein